MRWGRAKLRRQEGRRRKAAGGAGGKVEVKRFWKTDFER